MAIVFRVDASLQMGTGHVMRCLTLANALKAQGAECIFICREHKGNLIEKIQTSGFYVYTLSTGNDDYLIDKHKADNKHISLFHSSWLGTTQQQDAEQCATILKRLSVEWLVVDHYALDKTWQELLKPYYQKLMVIDDLGDREHIADLLLDQNYGSTLKKYKDVVPESCQVLTGPKFALLRPEFSLWRDYSLKRRKGKKTVNNILITLGGIDPNNYTGRILEQLAKTQFKSSTTIIVVMGAHAPHLESIREQAALMPVLTLVEDNVDNMAELMSNADLAIGAAGATTWERCCLGLPTIQLVIAENQRRIAEALAAEKAIKLLEDIGDLSFLISTVEQWLLPIATRAELLVDGLGSQRATRYIKEDAYL